ncbi:MAG: type II toxin-antitoxin system HicB family antitoxin [Candidatus Paceibacterota bacterium]|jgi:predicted RNase H-like HicB family nuclease
MLKKNIKKTYSFPVIIEKDANNMFVATVPSLKGCHTQAKTLETLYKRVQEVISLCLEANKDLLKGKSLRSTFIGVRNIELVR